jgi:RNA polymerase sigma-70 factor (ECF subfamily)
MVKLWKIHLSCIKDKNIVLFDFLNRKKYNSLSDEELILFYKEEQANFCIDIFYNRYGHLLLVIAFKYLKNREDSEDVVMNLFESLGSKILKYEIQNFKSWLHTTLKNECLMHLRKIKKINQTVSIDQLNEIAVELEEVDFKEVKEKIFINLESTIFGLKADQRKCIELFYLESKSYLEIADQLNLSLNSVKSAIQNGKRMLKVKLENIGIHSNNAL